MSAIAIAVLAFLCAFPAYFGTNGYVAYAAVTSVATIGLYIAYAIPIFLRLRAGDSWEPGEWNLGKWYRPVGIIACLWVVFISILFILPTNPYAVPWHTAQFKWTFFNYAPVAVGGMLLIVGVWWLVSARTWFTGPIAQGTAEELARIEARYEGSATGPTPSSA
jgi:amino acid transporter